MKSIWNDNSEIKNYPALQQDISADVAVIGGGITGVSTAKRLSQKGINVVLLESHKIGGSASSHSTGNLYFTIDKILSSLKKKYDTDLVKKVAKSRIQALEQIEEWVTEDKLECSYKTVPWYLYSNEEKSCEKIDQEYQAGKEAELPFLTAEADQLPFPNKRAIMIPRQHQINPMQYVQELAASIDKSTCEIYENTHVESVEENGKHYVLHTSKAKIEAEYVIHATHSPKGIKIVQSLLGPYREYGIGYRVTNKNIPDGIFWGYHENGKKFSTRAYTNNNGEQFLIVVGEPHKVGQAEDNISHINKLEEFANRYFDIQEVVYRWGGQNFQPADLLPYIGPVNTDSGEYIATGFSTDGLVYGTLAAMILSDVINGEKNEWDLLYDSTRNQPFKSAPEFIKENANVAKRMFKDYISTPGEHKIDDLKPGEGGVFKKDGDKIAVRRSQQGELEAVSAVCTHMKCIVQWNNAEESWDCPCHGSRFATNGEVLEGPAFHPLKPIDL